MECAPGGEVFDLIVREGRLSEKEANRFFHQVLSGVEYCHKLGIIHRDLKPENMLLDYKNNIKIVDFGLSNTFSEEKKLLSTPCGSPCYAAPEMIAGLKYEGEKTDIWSLGVVLFAFICGYLPFEDPSTSHLYRKILTADYEIPSEVPEAASDLIMRMLTINPQQRITVEEIKQHRWYNQFKMARYPQGLLIGVHQIPIDKEILSCMELIGLDKEATKRSLESNDYNFLTTTYYLMLRRVLMEGGASISDIGSPFFIPKLLSQKNDQRNQNLKGNQMGNGKENISSATATNSTTAKSSKQNVASAANLVIGSPVKNQVRKIFYADGNLSQTAKSLVSPFHLRALRNDSVQSQADTLVSMSPESNSKMRKIQGEVLKSKLKNNDVSSPSFFTASIGPLLIGDSHLHAGFQSEGGHDPDTNKSSIRNHLVLTSANSSLKSIGSPKSPQVNSPLKAQNSSPKTKETHLKIKKKIKRTQFPRKPSNDLQDCLIGQSFTISHGFVLRESPAPTRPISPKNFKIISPQGNFGVRSSKNSLFSNTHLNDSSTYEKGKASPENKEKPVYVKKQANKGKAQNKLKETLGFGGSSKEELNCEMNASRSKVVPSNWSFNFIGTPKEIVADSKINKSYRNGSERAAAAESWPAKIKENHTKPASKFQMRKNSPNHESKCYFPLFFIESFKLSVMRPMSGVLVTCGPPLKLNP